MVAEQKFDPSAHLTDLKGKDYLEVKWRIAWFRDAHPDGIIETEMVSNESSEAIFKAHVMVPAGGSATGYGSETRDDFVDYIEKAETKALGRALAALGFGTQFCEDFDEGGAVTDSPVQLRGRQPARSASPAPSQQGPRRMESRFGGECYACGNVITKGQEIYYDGAIKKAYHVTCYEAPVQLADDNDPGPW